MTVETEDLTAQPDKRREQRESVVIRFAGDSGDGMQLTGMQFTAESALAGNDVGTLPDYPAEIRAPAGTLAGVSGFQLNFSSLDIFTPGDNPDVLVVMNPAALKVNIKDLKAGGLLLADQDGFDQGNLKKAGYDSNPLEDGSLGKHQVVTVDMTGLTLRTLEELKLSNKIAARCKNFFALGLCSWLYSRPIEPTVKWIEEKFKKTPELVEANVRVLKAGYHFGETTEMFAVQYEVKPARIAPGTYRNITGNSALALGLVAAARKAGLRLFLGSYPITPASDILHELAQYKNYGVYTFQAEDEIAGVCSALGAAFGGNLGVTTSSGPGIALKQEAIGLAVMVELPLVICNVQRGGPSTGLPTKTEQADLFQAIFGRNSESPLPVIAASTPADCFAMAYEAARIAIKYMTPVILLTDGYLANGAEPWSIPRFEELPPIPVSFRTEPEGFFPYARDPSDARPPLGPPGHPWAGTPHRRDREAGHHGQYQLRPGKPRVDDALPGAQGGGGGSGYSAYHDPRRDERRTFGDRMGQHVRLDHGGGRGSAGPGNESFTRPSPLLESPSPGPGGDPPGVQEDSGAGDEHGPAPHGAAGDLSGRRRRTEQDSGPAVQGLGDRRGNPTSTGGVR